MTLLTYEQSMILFYNQFAIVIINYKMGGCAHKERFSLTTLNDPKQHMPTQFQANKVCTHSREILLKPNIYLSVTTKGQLDKSNVGEICSFEGATEQDKADRDHVLLKLTQSYYVEQQNYSTKHLKGDEQYPAWEESIVLDRKQGNMLLVPQGGPTPRKHLQNAKKIGTEIKVERKCDL